MPTPAAIASPILPLAATACTTPTYLAEVSPAGSPKTVWLSRSSTPPSMKSRPCVASSRYLVLANNPAIAVSSEPRLSHHDVQLSRPEPGEKTVVHNCTSLFRTSAAWPRIFDAHSMPSKLLRRALLVNRYI